MGRKGLTPEKIIARLREAEVLSSQGQPIMPFSPQPRWAGQVCSLAARVQLDKGDSDGQNPTRDS